MADFARAVCEVAVNQAGVSGAGVTAMGPAEGMAGHRGLLHATDAVARRLENVHLTLGVGPCADAHTRGVPCLVDDLEAAAPQWPMFTTEAAAAGAAAVFFFPLRADGTGLGTLYLYRDTAGPLSAEQTADAQALAVILAEALAARLAPEPTIFGDGLLANTQYVPVHIAAGMLAAWWDLEIHDALTLIRTIALAQAVAVTDLAEAIIAGRVGLKP
jgi:GAF domain-containing protein